MLLRTTRLVILAVTILTTAQTARADWLGWLNAPGRYLGVGWSDGYHSRTACPPKRHAAAVAPASAPAPWWTIPADGAEPLPHPAAQQPLTGRSAAPSGSSLFRQPGEGATTTARTAAAASYSK